MSRWATCLAIVLPLFGYGYAQEIVDPPPRASDQVFVSPALGLWSDEIDSAIIAEMEAGHVPGLAAARVAGVGAVWANGYGMADIESGTPVEATTLFMLASISKTITATALMQLYEDGLFGLDDDVNGYLPFNVRNPWHPDEPITFRMLLTHSSSINDNWSLMPYYAGDSPIPLGEYLEDYLTPTGDLYNKYENFNAWAPGTTWDYCNIGIGLAGYLVETINGMPFDDYCEQHIFTPLGMTETAWHLADLNPDHVAVPYSYDGSSHVPYEHYGYSDYPGGQLRTSVDQLARFLAAYINGGEYQGYRILEATTVDLMLSVHFNDFQGLAWRKTGNNWGHGGGDLGVRTTMYFNPAQDKGVIVLTNGENGDAMGAVAAMVFNSSVSDPGAIAGLTVGKVDGDTLELAWEADCGGASTYAVYRGDLSAGYGSLALEPGFCDVSGTSTQVPEGSAPGEFFLVVPVIDAAEGSYGIDSQGERRPQSTAPCYSQANIHACAP